ncbi:hypothetical protein SERLA73DRAFT_176098 [Serpula lacrymans var. lacrymans S7.3]|uniref:SH3 domain-containing protein n=2 Tax=Serpula lacrymans var. lacrymans TaxID=341189 RepID=F8PMB2_SERL3|nr:uncharacterized protein SERLADRAFT_458855 [Serpula lacrymans var. lacrymans S7.9]EGO02744.1 hypothetical protein SERLA73DRAFT_176098 [Serpula lacrymans var. lacrymans S7.3]EGO28445.1 hypothetical protein SERLADRAFT_458855 [Serpula lacrymans var. lacrymans S7.9]
MKFSTPLPQPLPKECAKAAKIFGSFVDSRNNGLDGVIPRNVLENAKGFAVFTIFKAGFVFSARAGSGIVIAKLSDGTWSAPSAIGTAGLGVGGQAGAEMTDFLIVLNSQSAVASFMSSGSLTLGGNMSIAIGPLGRNGEASGSLNTSGKVAAMYSYSKTRGLFGGISVEGSMIVERQDANALAYKSDVTAKMLLSGMVDPPDWASALITTISACTGMPGNRKWVDDRAGEPARYSFGGVASPGAEKGATLLTKKKKGPDFPPTSWGQPKNSGSFFSPENTEDASNTSWDDFGSSNRHSISDFDSHVQPKYASATDASNRRYSGSHGTTERYDPASPFNSLPPFRLAHSYLSDKTIAHSKSASTSAAYPSSPGQSRGAYTNPFSSSPPVTEDTEYDNRRRSTSQATPFIKPKPELAVPLSPQEGVGRAIALYNFKAVEAGDLSFSKGDVIIITRKSEKTDDWWKGKVSGKEGIFPANFVEVL